MEECAVDWWRSGNPRRSAGPARFGMTRIPLTRGARLRSWMEGWRITCPICGAALEDFRLYTRLFRADPADALLVRIEEQCPRWASRSWIACFRRRHGAAQPMPLLMRSLLFPQPQGPGERDEAAPCLGCSILSCRGRTISSSACRRKTGHAPPERWPERTKCPRGAHKRSSQ